MFILLLFAFISGLLTIAAPCIWPILPIVLSSTTTGGKRKPLGISLGVISSFGFFTLTLSYIVTIIPFDLDLLRLFAAVVIAFFGLTLLLPRLNQKVEGAISKISGKLNVFTRREGGGFESGFITGLALGVIWSPCAGPIFATIATLAATRSLNAQIILVTLVYIAGVGIPLFLFSVAGQWLFTESRFLSKYTGHTQKAFGVIMILTSFLIITNQDKVIQAKLLDVFPQYSNFLIGVENNSKVQSQLNKLKNDKSAQIQEKEGRPMDVTGSSLPILGRAPEFTGITHWLNSSPLTVNQLKGKVLLVDFWTYTCINCIRTLPYVTGWYDKYKDKGFVVVGVHTPEFEFEKKTENVQNAIKQFGIHYPVAQDNDYATWNAFDNHYWPAEYLIDTKGNVRRVHFGEGEYDASEMAIKQLLEESGNKIDAQTLNKKDQTPTDRLTPETYLGSNRAQPNDYVQLSKGWNIQPEYVESSVGVTLDLDFHASKVFLVITPKGGDDVDVLLDGKRINENVEGADVKNGKVILDTQRLYELVNLKGKTEDHRLQLRFNKAGTQLFAFTFG